MNTFGGIEIVVVEPGTVVGYDPDGNPMTVTMSTAVWNGRRCWVTQGIYDAIRAGKGGEA
jgi:hypothetical protein